MLMVSLDPRLLACLHKLTHLQYPIVRQHTILKLINYAYNVAHTHRVINKPPLDGLGDGLDCHSFQSMSLCLIKLEKKGGFAMHIKKKSHLPSVRGRFSIIFARPHSSSTTLASTTLISLGCLLNFSSFGLHIFLPLRGCQTSLFLRLASGSQKW